jgi:hypothetical protein
MEQDPSWDADGYSVGDGWCPNKQDTEMVNKCFAFYENEISLRFSQDPATGSCPDPADSSPHSHTAFQ